VRYGQVCSWQAVDALIGASATVALDAVPMPDWLVPTSTMTAPPTAATSGHDHALSGRRERASFHSRANSSS
jgi:hypothetical protein